MSELNNQTLLPQLPFERNHYFYGKLLTSRDLTDESAYLNEKRWLLNRLLLGSGVLCGLTVSADSATAATKLMIDPGVALDALGREIVVTGQETIERVNIQAELGITAPSSGNKKTGFLCLEFVECPREPLPTLGSSTCEEVCDFNRIRESYRLKWKDGDEENEPLCQNWLNRQTVSAANAVVRVERTTPVWALPDEVFEVALKVTALRDSKVVGLRIYLT